MSHALTAMISSAPATTVCTVDETCYRSDNDGFVHVLPKHVAELQARGHTLATDTSTASAKHKGAPLTYISEA